jgi:hypothetical protein
MNTLDDAAMTAVRALRDVLSDIRNMTTAIGSGRAPSAPELTSALDSLASRIEGAWFAYACAAVSQAMDDGDKYRAGFIAGREAERHDRRKRGARPQGGQQGSLRSVT